MSNVQPLMPIICCLLATVLVLLFPSSGVDGQLFSMFLNSPSDSDADEIVPLSSGGFNVRDYQTTNDNDGSYSRPQNQPKRKKLYVFSQAELGEVSGQDIDLDDADQFFERDDAFIVTMGTNSSRFINRDNVAWELIKLLRTKVMSETEAWMNMKLAEESILEKFKGKQKSLAKIVLKNIWGRRKAAHVRKIKNMLDVIQDLYLKLISKTAEGQHQNATQLATSAGQLEEVGDRSNWASNAGHRLHKPIVFPDQVDKYLLNIQQQQGSNNNQDPSANHFPDIPVGPASQHHGHQRPISSSNIGNNRKPPVAPSGADKGFLSGVHDKHKSSGFPDAVKHFPDVLTPGVGIHGGNNKPSGGTGTADNKQRGQGSQSLGVASNSVGSAGAAGEKANGEQAVANALGSKGTPAVDPSKLSTAAETSVPSQGQPQKSAALIEAPGTSNILPSTTSEILKLLLVNFTELQQQTPTAAKQPAANPDPGVEWSYDENDVAGPPKWGEFFPHCAGQRQSPVDIIVDDTEETEFDDLVFDNLDSLKDNVSIQHSGHTVKLQLKGPSKIVVKGGGLGSDFVLVQIHFHWGSKIFRGSEHQLQRRRFPAEMHMVFRNQAYNVDEEAMLHDDGLAVMGFFVNVQPRDNRELDEFFKSLDLVRSPKAKHLTNNPINLKNLVAPCLEGTFFRYNGSLTTPGCQEAVIWTLFETPIGVSLRQLKAFQRLEEKSGEPLFDNWRPLQPLNGRKVLRKRGGIRTGRVSLFNTRATSASP